MQSSGVSWTDFVVNPAVGCTEAGTECKFCWAERFSQRRAGDPDAADYYKDLDWTAENADEVITTLPHRLDQPALQLPDHPARIWVGSMTDVFHPRLHEEDDRAAEHSIACVELARMWPDHEWLYLTKRPWRVAELQREYGLKFPANCRLGVSVGSGSDGPQDTTHRLDTLCDEISGVSKWLSAEPLVGPVDVGPYLHDLDWVIVGGETAPDGKRREMDHAWAVDIYEQCQQFDVPFYFKQVSGRFAEAGIQLNLAANGSGLIPDKRQVIRQEPPLRTGISRRPVADGGESQ